MIIQKIILLRKHMTPNQVETTPNIIQEQERTYHLLQA